MHLFSSQHKVGILGGGQLGKMLLYTTRKFDIQTYVLDPNPEAPSKIACDAFFVGDLMDYETVFEFGKKVDTLTIEIENVNVSALRALENEGVNVYPAADTLAIIQNKAKQKLFYSEHGLPTASFTRYTNSEELTTAIENEAQTLPFVWKSAQFGYDGKGVKVIRTLSDMKALPDVECIAEDLVPFKKELAVTVARSPQGEIRAYPVVEMEFHPEANQVEYVLCPARISNAIEKKAERVALNTAAAFKHVGLLAVELFLTQDDNILINEVAPRPHNSGHQTIEASYTSQFEQHIRAVLNLPLGETRNKVSGVMVNLVGAEGYNGAVVYQNIEKILELEGVTPHIYGKKETRPFRKMGHVTIVHSEIDKAREIAQQVKETIKVISK
ncbi:phosphoribosylaminoimidazole carboxylase [Formosa sp. Hel3_A1_48]|jgi:5-(carboxyamino)imidazole ribonucleotide synthase|uniref:5-(carboxyamino)imidazole ribonucleotide synthase n=1 Tax=Formosa sp. Hel3_A1_48 TaxID=1336795 RepID=UPI00084E25B2|nr:5-(carboxyamino)imidazole ribonucleotide synthase [Formosa sp. Hel3_A1_48]AOR25982.1 phosphoribosylaminoimidazole carboxylase [Formosa sp. Hel3_A1_48]MDC0950693.1 5-(carboxyamino)imidazole ribonucleotide synthase [Flavobacteriaceae bacterium]